MSLVNDDDLKKLRDLSNKIKEGGMKAIEDIFGVDSMLLAEYTPPPLIVKNRVSWLTHGNQGLHGYRFSQNPHEAAAAELWDDQNYKARTLDYILGDGSRVGFPTERDEIVAATLMQWLGSPVGRSFLTLLLEAFEKIDKKIRKADEAGI